MCPSVQNFLYTLFGMALLSIQEILHIRKFRYSSSIHDQQRPSHHLCRNKIYRVGLILLLSQVQSLLWLAISYCSYKLWGARDESILEIVVR